MFLSFPIRKRRAAGMLVLSAILLLSASTAGHAQSFFEALFGGKKPAPAPSFSVQPQRLAPPGGYPQTTGGPLSRAPAIGAGRSPRTDADHDDDRSSSGKGGQRTVCVRLCDGYYWPVSFQVKRSQFQKDARICESSCNGEARLFHFPSLGEIHDAVDSSGRSYARLPAAFLYRKKLVAGCACRPEAWSDAEVSRHQVYAIEEKARVAEEKAADDARTAAAEAKKAEGELRLAEANSTGKKGGARGAAKLPQGAAALAVSAATQTSAQSAQGAGADAVAPVSASPSFAAADLPSPTPTKPRNRRNRDSDSQLVVRTAAVADPARRPRPQPLAVSQRPPAVKPTYASAAPGPFAKKYTWPGD
jgi:hypothetical protein